MWNYNTGKRQSDGGAEISNFVEEVNLKERTEHKGRKVALSGHMERQERQQATCSFPSDL